jgi:Flp pilus assembly pilin Flp
MVEYGLVVAAVVAGGVVVFTAFQTQLSAAFVTLEAAITAAL